MKLKQLPNVTRVDAIVEQIRRFIEKNGMKAGDRLPSEPIFMENLGVSRGILREAIRRLETLGVLSVEHGRGMFVGSRNKLLHCAQLFRSAMTISLEDIEQFNDFRRMIECYAVRRACERVTAEDLAYLESLCEKMDPARHSYDEVVRFDCEFHLKIVAIAGNELVRNIMAVLQEFLLADIWKTSYDPRDQQANGPLHLEIVAALRARDTARAERLMNHHIDRCDELVRELKAGTSKESQP